MGRYEQLKQLKKDHYIGSIDALRVLRLEEAMVQNAQDVAQRALGRDDAWGRQLVASICYNADDLTAQMERIGLDLPPYQIEFYHLPRFAMTVQLYVASDQQRETWFYDVVSAVGESPDMAGALEDCVWDRQHWLREVEEWELDGLRSALGEVASERLDISAAQGRWVEREFVGYNRLLPLSMKMVARRLLTDGVQHRFEYRRGLAELEVGARGGVDDALEVVREEIRYERGETAWHNQTREQFPILEEHAVGMLEELDVEALELVLGAIVSEERYLRRKE